MERILCFIDNKVTENELESVFQIKNGPYWNTEREKQKMINGNWTQNVVPYNYRPFDRRWLLYQPNLIEIGRGGASKFVMYHMLHRENFGLCAGRAGQVIGSQRWDIIFCSSDVTDTNIFYRGGAQFFPLYLYPVNNELQLDTNRYHNLNLEFVKAFSEKLGLKFIEDGKGDLRETFGPEDIFNYAYAIFHSPTYRNRYAEFLKIDFPRLPLTSDKALFKSLVENGSALVSLHLMESLLLNTPITKYEVKGEHAVDKVSYDEKTQRVYINKKQYFEGVPLEVWEFHIGGYHVAHKWLKDRKGRTLSYDELAHYQKIMVALNETIRLMTEIDSLIIEWPIG